jgi:putative ABC transport system permease protein
MKTPLVLLNLLHQPRRTLLAVLGVAFAVLLIFMQLGFYHYAESAATALYDALDFDLVLLSSNYLSTTRPSSFPVERLYQARQHPDVASVTPLYIDWQGWLIKKPGGPQRRVILVLAFPLDTTPFRPEVFQDEPANECQKHLHVPDTVLMDTETRNSFGPPQQRRVGEETELNQTRIRIVGRFTIGTGLGADGMVLTSTETYAHLRSPQALRRPALGLVRLQPQAKGRANKIQRELNQAFYSAYPHDEVRLLSRQEIKQKEQDYWMYRTSVGIIFLIGVFIALIVGAIFVYQVIATDIADHFAEYATLKAIGYPGSYLNGMVLRQALVLAVLGYLLAYPAALGLYELARHNYQLPLSMTRLREAAVLLLAIAMCSVSGLFALRKVKAADPADLF